MLAGPPAEGLSSYIPDNWFSVALKITHITEWFPGNSVYYVTSLIITKMFLTSSVNNLSSLLSTVQVHYFLAFLPWTREQIILFMFETDSYISGDCFHVSSQFSSLWNKQLKSFKLFQDDSYSVFSLLLFLFPAIFPLEPHLSRKALPNTVNSII